MTQDPTETPPPPVPRGPIDVEIAQIKAASEIARALSNITGYAKTQGKHEELGFIVQACTALNLTNGGSPAANLAAVRAILADAEEVRRLREENRRLRQEASRVPHLEEDIVDLEDKANRLEEEVKAIRIFSERKDKKIEKFESTQTRLLRQYGGLERLEGDYHAQRRTIEDLATSKSLSEGDLFYAQRELAELKAKCALFKDQF